MVAEIVSMLRPPSGVLPESHSGIPAVFTSLVDMVRSGYLPSTEVSVSVLITMKVTTESVSCKPYKMNSAFIPISHFASLPHSSTF